MEKGSHVNLAAKNLDRLKYIVGSPSDFIRLLRATASNRWHRLTLGLGPKRVRCNLCGWQGRRFDYFRERHFVTPNVQCPGCGSQRRNRELASFIERELSPNGLRVLDVAPAPHYREWFSKRGAEYISIDYGERRAMVRMDARRLAFPDRAFDLVILSHVLEHVPDFEVVLAEVRRTLEVGGCALIDVPFADRPDSRRLSRPDHQGHWHNFGRDVSDLIAAAGFEVQPASYSPDRQGPENTFFLARRADRPPTVTP